MPSESTIEAFRDAMLQLMPPGDAVDLGADGDFGRLVEALSVEHARVFEKQEDLLVESLPSDSTIEGLLPLWESIFNLPGECDSLADTESGRQAAVRAKMRGRAGHAQSVFESIVEAMGYDNVTFERYDSDTDWFGAGSGAGSYVTADSYAFVVRVYVDTSEGPDVDDQLICLLNEALRAHGFLEITIEGPMGATRNTLNLYDAQLSTALLEAADIADIPAIPIRYRGDLTVQVLVHDVDGVAVAPSSSPQGEFEAYVSVDGNTFSKCDEADAALSLIGMKGDNAIINRAIQITELPGTALKLVYVPDGVSPGGGGDERVTVRLASW